MCCERKEFEIFSCLRGKRLGKKQKEEKKSRLGREQKEEKKSSFLRAKKSSKKQKALKRRVKKEKRDTKRIFFQRHKFSSFFARLSLEKIHLIERRLRTQRRLYEDSLRRESVEERDDVFFRRK